MCVGGTRKYVASGPREDAVDESKRLRYLSHHPLALSHLLSLSYHSKHTLEDTV
jgi:hypothetical protein